MQSNRVTEAERLLREHADAPLTDTLRNFWTHSLAEIAGSHEAGSDGCETAGRIATLADAVVLCAYRSVTGALEPPRHALVALGGFGRGEMAPFSDIDLLFLFAKDKEKEFISGVLNPLWDMGFDVGHSSRTAREAEQMAREDLESCTAMLDSRLLAGDQELFAEYQRRVYNRIPRGTPARLRNLRQAHRAGNGSVQLLEPDVKSSPGGLRELQTLEWALRGKGGRPDVEILRHQFLEDQDIAALERGRRFLWRVRHQLHFDAGRRQDVLRHEAQPDVAAGLGYHDAAAGLGVELFMQSYYLHARDIQHLVDLALARLTRKLRHPMRNKLLEPGVTVGSGEIIIPSGVSYFSEEPLRLLSIFALAQTKGLALSERVQRARRSCVELIGDDFRRSSEARDLFMRMLRRKSRTAQTLRQMHDLGVLGAYLPEFGEITCLVQYDIYHIYTVDEHTLVALDNLESLIAASSETTLSRVLEGFPRRDLLCLAVLLHDVGKARREGHIPCGVEMTRELCQRLGLPEADTRMLLFLVEHHQDLVIMSQRRDLDDYRMIADFASIFSSSEELDALYLVSYADLSAVAREAWTQWEGALLWELYHKTSEQLASGIKTLEEKQRARLLLDGHLEEIGGTWSALRVVAFQEHVQQLPPRYLVAYDRDQIASHIDLVGQLGDASVEVAFSEQPTFTEIAVCTRDQRHLLADICGVLAVNDINILRADVHTRNDGVVLDVFQVVDVGGSPRLPDWKQERVGQRLAEVIRGETKVEQLFGRYSASWDRRRKAQTPSRHARGPEVRFENQVSNKFTVIDTDVADDVGLLYRITRALGELDLDIHMAIVNTVVSQAQDAFYVVDAHGEKIVNYEVFEQIRERLLADLTT